MIAHFPFWLHIALLALLAVASFASGYMHGREDEKARGQKRRSRDEHLLIAAHNCASKLRCEMQRRTVEPKAEYDMLIEEAEKHCYE